MERRTWMLDRVLGDLGLKVDQAFRIEDELFASYAKDFGLTPNTIYGVDETGDMYIKRSYGYRTSPITFANMLANASCEARFVPMEGEFE